MSVCVIPFFQGARRWVPWICAYTGARVNEITQLRPEDFMVHEGIDVIRIIADATKRQEYRLVPLHDHLLEQGLLKYVKMRGKLPLFYDPGRHRGGKSANPQYQKRRSVSRGEVPIRSMIASVSPAVRFACHLPRLRLYQSSTALASSEVSASSCLVPSDTDRPPIRSASRESVVSRWMSRSVGVYRA